MQIYNQEQLQTAIDNVFRDLFIVENRTSDNRAYVYAKVDETTPGLMCTNEADPGIIFHSFMPDEDIEILHERINHRFRGKMTTEIQDGKLVLRIREKTLEEMAEDFRQECRSDISHEIQHLAFYALDEEKEKAVVEEVKERLGSNFEWYKERVRKSYKIHDMEVEDIDRTTVMEILGEIGNLTYNGHALTKTSSYFSNGKTTLKAFMPLFPIADAVLKNYAISRGFRIGWNYRTMSRLQNHGIRERDMMRVMRDNIDYEQPFSLPVFNLVA
ncbi:hypothetical protein HOC80_03570 [archaeon]|jgi:hypothetical protein|nr:hypothetical protein [archaeon]MBT4417156.1 hypothetical protein [archaeon]